MDKEISNYLKPLIEYHTKTMIMFRGMPIYIPKFCKDEVHNIVEKSGVASEFYPIYRSDKDQQAYLTEIVNKVCYENKLDRARERFEEYMGDVPESSPLDNYVPIVDHKTGKHLLVNPNTKRVSDTSYEAWEMFLDPDTKKILPEIRRLAVLQYDPYNIDSLNMVDFEDYKILRVNLYIPPQWRFKPDPNKPCPDIIKRLLVHLFPVYSDREYVKDWLYNATVMRNETYLVLNGAKGAGKGIFATLCKSLVGRTHYTEAPESFLDTQFNSVLDKKRMLALDEFKVDKARHTKLKRFINKYQNIEKKGMDANESSETHNSYLIMNNDESDMYLEHDDRRFSVPEISSDRLETSMSEEEITSLVRQLEDEESQIVYEFGYYIFNRGAKKHDPFSVLKTPKFHRLVYTSLVQWQKYLVDFLTTTKDHSVPLSKLRRVAEKGEGKRPVTLPQASKVADFLNSYYHKGKCRLGSIEEDVITVLGDNFVEETGEEDNGSDYL